MASTDVSRGGLAAVRGGVAVAAGCATAAAVAVTTGWRFGPAAGWITAAVVFLRSTWATVARMDPQSTASHATREDSTRGATELLMIAASLASLAGVGYLLAAATASGTDADVAAAVGMSSVAAAWLVVHTVFTLRYARLFYLDGAGGIDFNQGDDLPAYADFAYLAFTIGMTYQVSDTDLQTRSIRATALRQALLSFVLGAVILATTINLVAGLSSSGR
ncbi:MAG: DUF1345 domain-containing protein [Actinomycetota bacterium]|nr:DUF1345 domain-containing protein [Actinomycetota bacterium]